MELSSWILFLRYLEAREDDRNNGATASLLHGAAKAA
jgi:hypothetical protein